MTSRFLPWLLCTLLLSLAGAGRAEQCLVIGDSLTKEYETEFPLLFPQNPASWNSRNWIEILHQYRNGWFDLGDWGTYADPRLTGHEHNWAFPGATTTEIKSQLNTWTNLWWIGELKGQLKNAVQRVVIFAGGTGNPYFSTDTAAALRAMEIGADVLLKATSVEGIYTADPKKVADATKFETITYMEIIKLGLRVMDTTAVSLCKDNNLPMIIFSMREMGNIVRVVQGEKLGSLVTA